MHLGQQETQMSNQYESDHQVFPLILIEQPEEKNSKLKYNSLNENKGANSYKSMHVQGRNKTKKNRWCRSSFLKYVCLSLLLGGNDTFPQTRGLVSLTKV